MSRSRLLVCGSETWTEPIAIRALLEVARPDVVVHTATGAGWLGAKLAAELGIAIEPFPLTSPWMRKALRAANATHTAAFVVGLAGAISPDLDGGLVPHVRGLPIGERRDVAGLPLVVQREGGVEGPPSMPRAPKVSDLAIARDELRRLWWWTPWARTAIAPAGEAAAAAVDQGHAGPGFSRDLDARIAAAKGAVEQLRLAEPRIAPWLVLAERLLKKWAPR